MRFRNIFLVIIFNLVIIDLTKAEEKTTTAKEEVQKPINVAPSVSIGWGYDAANYFSAAPGVELSLDLKSATGRKVGFSTSATATYTEFVDEEGVESSDDLRVIAFDLTAGGSTEITSKVKASLDAEANISRNNTYENASGDSEWMKIGPKMSFTPAEKTTISFAYYFDLLNLHTPFSYPVKEGATDDTLASVRGMNVYPTSIYSPTNSTNPEGVYYQSVFGPSYLEPGDTTNTVDYKNYVNLSLAQSFINKMAPSLKGGYSLTFNRDSNNDTRDLWLSHTISGGIKQPLWQKATFDIGLKFDIKNYDSTLSLDESEFRQDLMNEVSVKLSQDFNDFLGISGGYTNQYKFGNKMEEGPLFVHSGSVSLTAKF